MHFQRHLRYVDRLLIVVPQASLVAASLNFVYRGRRDVGVTALDQQRDLAVKQRQQQGARWMALTSTPVMMWW